jgi:hypothetical protein
LPASPPRGPGRRSRWISPASGLDDGSDAGNLSEDNWVHDVGADYQASIGVYLEDIVDSTLQHNQIDDLPFSGIAQTISNHQSWGGVAAKRMRFTDNFWDDDKLIFYGSRRGLRIKANRLLPRTRARVACKRIAACREILGAAGLEPAWRYLIPARFGKPAPESALSESPARPDTSPGARPARADG